MSRFPNFERASLRDFHGSSAPDMWWMLFPRWIWFLLGHCCALLLCVDRVRAMPMSVAKVVYSHAGMCPNELNPNLWVDAMSTCMRECESDQVSLDM